MGIHWLTISLTGLSEDTVKLILEDVTGMPLEVTGGARWFDRRFSTVCDTGSAYFLSGHRGDGEKDMISVTITGDMLDHLSFSDIEGLFSRITLAGGIYKITRCDYALDGFPISVTEFRDSLDNGDISTRAHSYKYIQNCEAGVGHKSGAGHDPKVSYGLVIGSRFSNRYTRVYDRRGTVRLEVELKNEDADMFFRAWLSSFDLVDCFIDLVFDLFKFQSSIIKEFLLAFTEKLNDYPRIGKVARTMLNKVNWLIKSVSKTYSGVKEVLPELDQILLRQGSRRLTPGERMYYQIAKGLIA